MAAPILLHRGLGVAFCLGFASGIAWRRPRSCFSS
jgi:hypothetical protein